MPDHPMSLAAVQVAGEAYPRVFRISEDLQSMVQYAFTTQGGWIPTSIPLGNHPATARSSLAATTYTLNGSATVSVYYVDAGYALMQLASSGGTFAAPQAVQPTGSAPILDDSLIVAFTLAGNNTQEACYLTGDTTHEPALHMELFNPRYVGPPLPVPAVPHHPYGYAAATSPRGVQFVYLVPPGDTPGSRTLTMFSRLDTSFGPPTTFDFRCGDEMVAILSAQGAQRVYAAGGIAQGTGSHIIEVRQNGDGTWQTPQDLTAAGKGVQHAHGTALAALVGTDGMSPDTTAGHVYYIGIEADKSVRLHALIDDDDSDSSWYDYNVNAHTVPADVPPPYVTLTGGNIWVRSSRLAIVQGRTGHYVYYIGTDNNIWQFWYYGAPGSWHAQQVSTSDVTVGV